MLRSSGVVIIVSDGWDRGDPALVRREMARLQRSCHRLIWLDPLFGPDVYQPLAGGMKAAYPFIDDLVAVNDLASLEQLGDLLADMADHRSRRPDRAGRPARAPARPQPPVAPCAAGRPTMRELLPIIEAWQAEGVAIARAVVVRTFGSVSAARGCRAALAVGRPHRRLGQRRLRRGRHRGALAEARATGLERVVRFGISDEQAWDVGLACGGIIDVLVQPRDP